MCAEHHFVLEHIADAHKHLNTRPTSQAPGPNSKAPSLAAALPLQTPGPNSKAPVPHCSTSPADAWPQLLRPRPSLQHFPLQTPGPNSKAPVPYSQTSLQAPGPNFVPIYLAATSSLQMPGPSPQPLGKSLSKQGTPCNAAATSNAQSHSRDAFKPCDTGT